MTKEAKRGTAKDLGLQAGDRVAIPNDGERGDLSLGEKEVTILLVDDEGTYFSPPSWEKPELVIVFNRETNTHRWPTEDELAARSTAVKEPEVFAQGIGKYYGMYRLVSRD